jgi:hypothetical protein
VDFGIFTIVIWVACFAVVSIDSQVQGISPIFWRLAGLFGGPFALVAYGIAREIRAGNAGGKD